MEETVKSSSLEEANRLFKLHSETHWKYGKRSLKQRKKDLRVLKKAVLDRRKAIAEAVNKDFGKPSFESDVSEVFPVVSAIRHALKKLERWTSIQPVRTPLSFYGTKAWVKPEPKGSVLIIAPWNFPFMLCLEPLVSALSAGNCAILKPSESTPHTAKLIQELISSVFPEEQVAVLNGGAELSAHLCSLPFHHIFFTGGTEVGKKIMRAASDNLTDVTLELGGKSPGIVDASAPLKETAKRIVQGRFLNGGQVCIAIDYLLVQKDILDRLVEGMEREIKRMFHTNEGNLSKMVHADHYEKMVAFVEDARTKGATVVQFQNPQPAERYYPPTLLLNPTKEMRVMQEEIFGPILPILSYEDLSEVDAHLIDLKSRPLAFYIFSKKKKRVRQYMRSSRAGSTGINEVIVQFGHPNLPFGGINSSGIGKAHGKAGFDAFTNKRSVVKKRFNLNASYWIRPPYTPLKQKVIDILIRWF